MSQNGPHSGPPWSHGGSDEPYGAPADPWGDHGSPMPDPSWAHPAVPHQSGSYLPPPSVPGPPSWSGAPTPPGRSVPLIAVLATLSVLILVGLGTMAWLLSRRTIISPKSQGGVSATASSVPAPTGSEDARFRAEAGDCVVNEGTDQVPEMRTTACAVGTYQVLKRVNGTTTGEKDAELKCARVVGYTKWYFYDSPFDDLDFVLCLREQPA